MNKSTIYKTGAAVAAGCTLAYLAATCGSAGGLKAAHQVGVKTEDEQDAQTPEYDFVIIGGGTASLALANRLSASGKHTVLVLEAGQSGVALQESTMPAAFMGLQRTVNDWSYWTTPQPLLNNRELPWTRTKVLGGCSAGNAMIFHNGAPEDYDRWAEMQGDDEEGRGWAFKGFQKYLQRFETFVPHPDVPIDLTERGHNGPVQIGYFAHFTALGGAFIEACDKLGINKTDDVNTSKGSLGVTRTPTYITPQGQRSSTERAYLTSDVLARRNLKVATGAHVTKIRFDRRSKTPRAVGVEFAETRNGPTFFVKAKKEVLLTAGAVNTPQILMLSGVGDAKQLKQHNINVVKDLPGVGKHLQDHLVVNVCFATNPRVSGISSRRIFTPSTFMDRIRLTTTFLEYKLFGTGYLTMHSQDSLAFIRVGDGAIASELLAQPDMVTALGEPDSTSAKTAPDIEIMVSSLAWRDHGHAVFDVGDAMSITPVMLRPSSMGEITLHSSDPWDKVIVDPKYMSTRRDMETMVRGIRVANKIAQQEPMRSLLNLDDTSQPLLDHGLDAMSDQEIEGIVRARCETLYHPTSTARMAPLGDGGVVDTSLRVYGIDGLRVVDASIMPEIVSGHTAGPTIAIAEKASDIILQSWKTN
ncbi:hypothetical protein FRB96_009164 [Tulasnella sp. 330]|nr:hypothetical protein FRB96_009164 [Tulasnella sp. 330]